MRNQGGDRSSDASHVRAGASPPGVLFLLPVGTASASLVRGGIDVVDVARGGADGGADPQGVVLATDEHLEVVVNDGLGQGGDPTVAPGMKEDRVPTEAVGLAGDGGLGAVGGASELSMAGAGGESGRDRHEQLGALEVVGGRKRLA